MNAFVWIYLALFIVLHCMYTVDQLRSGPQLKGLAVEFVATSAGIISVLGFLSVFPVEDFLWEFAGVVFVGIAATFWSAWKDFRDPKLFEGLGGDEAALVATVATAVVGFAFYLGLIALLRYLSSELATDPT